MKLALLLALCLPAWGQHNVGPVGAALTASGAIHADTQPNRVKGNPTNRLWRISLVTVAGASAADWASSLGHYERNALATRLDGRFAARRGALIKAASFGANAAIQAKMPRHRKLWTVLNFAVAGVYAGAAIYNVRQ